MTDPRYVPPSDGQPADIEEEAPDVEYEPLPFDEDESKHRVGCMLSFVTRPPRCSECGGTRSFHKTNCPLYRP